MPSVGPSAGMQVNYILSHAHAHMNMDTLYRVWLINLHFSQAFKGATFRSTAVAGVQSLAQRRYSLCTCSLI